MRGLWFDWHGMNVRVCLPSPDALWQNAGLTVNIPAPLFPPFTSQLLTCSYFFWNVTAFCSQLETCAMIHASAAADRRGKEGRECQTISQTITDSNLSTRTEKKLVLKHLRSIIWIKLTLILSKLETLEMFTVVIAIWCCSGKCFLEGDRSTWGEELFSALTALPEIISLWLCCILFRSHYDATTLHFISLALIKSPVLHIL